MLALVLVTVLAGGVGIAVFVYYLKQGQFDDPEDVKYQMFREDEPSS